MSLGKYKIHNPNAQDPLPSPIKGIKEMNPSLSTYTSPPPTYVRYTGTVTPALPSPSDAIINYSGGRRRRTHRKGGKSHRKTRKTHRKSGKSRRHGRKTRRH